GNEYDFKQEFSGEDNTAPELIGTIPSDMSDLDACIDSYEGPSEDEIAALFHEECGLSVVKTTHRTGSNCGNGWINSFEYTVSDACGNSYPTFKIIYQGSDQSAPEWAYDYKVWTDNSVTGVCPDDAYVSLQVGDVISQFDSYIFNGYTVDFIANPAVTDNCTAQADIKIRVVNITETSDGCSSNIAVDVVAEDSCGNASAVYTKNHVTNDTVAPVIDCPTEVIDLGHDPAFSHYANGGDPRYYVALDVFNLLAANDNCKGALETTLYSGTIQPYYTNDPNVMLQEVTMGHMVDDGCGNVSYCTVVYTYTSTLPNPDDSSRTNGLSPADVFDQGSSSANEGDEVSLDFQAYPVPFNQDVTVKYMFEFDTNVTVEVYDTRGLLVMSKTAAYSAGTDATMPLSINGADQMYYVKLITNKGTVTKKILASKL
ncbi:T9SS type A sorting domain-containing protein, partial [Flavobacteriaceae bacterium S0825]|uniref:T9SS type A sorting domain-containing protein n=1 Tax=Gaetbulibacter sp. S0825 TaxID=2720084 RepID=UPI00142F730C